MGRYTEAIVDFDKALALNPQGAKAYANRGLAKSGLGRHEEARADLELALELATEQGNKKSAQLAKKMLSNLPAGNPHEDKK